MVGFRVSRFVGKILLIQRVSPSLLVPSRVILELLVMPTVGHLKAIDLRRSHVEALRNYLRTAQPAEVIGTAFHVR